MLTKFLARFSRVTSSGRVIPEIDGLRFVAIWSVVIFHLSFFVSRQLTRSSVRAMDTAWFAHILQFGRWGVELFFVISGFVIALPFASHYLKGTPRVELNRYYIRRVTRIAPPYLLIMLALYFWFTLHGHSAQSLFPHLVASLLYVHGLVFGEASVINPVAWTLEIEIQFYLLMPAFAFLFAVRRKRLRRLILVSLAAGFASCQMLFFPEKGMLSVTVANYFQYFLMGFLLVDIYLSEWDEVHARYWRWDVVVFGGLALLFFGLDKLPMLHPIMLPFIILLFCYAVFRSILVNQILTSSSVVTVGGMCYSIYLIHLQLIQDFLPKTFFVASQSSFSVNLLVQFLIIGPILIVTSAIYFAFVERPCMYKDWPRQVIQGVSALQFIWSKGDSGRPREDGKER